jgi:DME family drug/metabolite transporter
MLSTTTATRGAVAALLEPVTAAGLGAVVLGDRLGAAGTAGALLVAAAVALAARQER